MTTPAARPGQPDGLSLAAAAACEASLEPGRWFHKGPALHPKPGRLHLGWAQCRGSGRAARPRE